jgi:transmembrane sensor
MKFKVKRFLSSKLKKFQDKELGAAQTSIINNWFDEKEFGEIKPQVLLEDHSRSELRDQLFNGILEGVAKQHVRHWYQNNWLKAAAVLFLVSTLCMLLLRQKDDRSQGQLVYRIYETRKGEVKKIILPDGSSIWMNSATLISIPEHFTTFKIREVKMDYGEAFFQVKRNPLKPFQIKTGKYLTTVLGTSFNIRSYPGDSSYQVAVTTGRVKVEKKLKNGFSLLSPGLVKGEILDFKEQVNHEVIKKGNTEKLMSWTTGKYIELEDMDLLRIGKALERHYGVRVEVRIDKDEKKKYTITFAQSTIAEAVQHLARETGINYQLTHHSLIIKKNR